MNLPTKEELKTEWVKALRSGEYKQGRNELHPADDTYCCLGVLCDVYRKMTGNGEWTDSRTFVLGAPVVGGRVYFHHNLPTEVLHHAGLTPRDETNLIMLNDHSKRSFDEIADYIEKNL